MMMIMIAVFLIFWFLVYSPKKNSILFLSSQASSLEGQTRRIEKIISTTKTIEGSAGILRKRIQELNEKFSQVSEEASLKMLSDFAQSLNLKVLSMNAHQKKAFLDENNNKEVAVKGRACQVLPVSIGLEGYYVNFVKYLEVLDKNLPVFWIIQGIKINRESPNSALLNIILDVNLYLGS
jgi:hypothetical protein